MIFWRLFSGGICEKGCGCKRHSLSGQAMGQARTVFAQSPQPWASVGRQPAGAGRQAFCGFLRPERAGATCPRNIPAAAPDGDGCARWGGKGGLAQSVAAVSLELDLRGKLDWSGLSFLDGSFAPAKKGATASAKPSAARARSGWWWSTAKVFLWEADWSRPARGK